MERFVYAATRRWQAPRDRGTTDGGTPFTNRRPGGGAGRPPGSSAKVPFVGGLLAMKFRCGTGSDEVLHWYPATAEEYRQNVTTENGTFIPKALKIRYHRPVRQPGANAVGIEVARSNKSVEWIDYGGFIHDGDLCLLAKLPSTVTEYQVDSDNHVQLSGDCIDALNARMQQDGGGANRALEVQLRAQFDEAAAKTVGDEAAASGQPFVRTAQAERHAQQVAEASAHPPAAGPSHKTLLANARKRTADDKKWNAEHGVEPGLVTTNVAELKAGARTYAFMNSNSQG